MRVLGDHYVKAAEAARLLGLSVDELADLKSRGHMLSARDYDGTLKFDADLCRALKRSADERGVRVRGMPGLRPDHAASPGPSTTKQEPGQRAGGVERAMRERKAQTTEDDWMPYEDAMKLAGEHVVRGAYFSGALEAREIAGRLFVLRDAVHGLREPPATAKALAEAILIRPQPIALRGPAA